MRKNSLILAIFLAKVSFAFPAQTLRLEGQPFKPTVPIVWDHPATNLPSTITMYKVLPQKLSEEAFSNVLALAPFTMQTVKFSADKKAMSWKRYEGGGGRLQYSLDMAPVHGFIEYHDYVVTGAWTNAPQGVPSRAEVETLAMNYLQSLGGDTNQLCLKRHSATEGKRSRYDKTAKKYTNEAVYMRGTIYPRQVDGIRIEGDGWQAFAIDFSNGGKVSSLRLNWRNLQPFERKQTASQAELLSWIREGKGVLPLTQNANLDELPQATKLTIKGVTPYYLGAGAGSPQEFMYPFVEFEVEADLGVTNKLTVQLDCPILSEGQ